MRLTTVKFSFLLLPVTSFQYLTIDTVVWVAGRATALLKNPGSVLPFQDNWSLEQNARVSSYHLSRKILINWCMYLYNCMVSNLIEGFCQLSHAYFMYQFSVRMFCQLNVFLENQFLRLCDRILITVHSLVSVDTVVKVKYFVYREGQCY